MDYTEQQQQDIITIICERLMDGESLRHICKTDDMPNKSTVLRWLNKDSGHATSIARAREFQAEALDDDIQDVTKRLIDGEIKPEVARVAIWAMQWRASKMKPRKYGEKQVHAHEGNVSVTISKDDSKL